MKVQQYNAEERLLSVASSMQEEPVSWKNWHALHIQAVDCEEDDFIDVIISAKAIIESFLQDTEGAAYFCNNKDIYIIGKNLPLDVLQQTAEQIKELIFSENFLSCEYRIYDLNNEAIKFTENILSNIHPGWVANTASFGLPEQEHKKTPMLNGHNRQTTPKVLLIEDDAVTRWIVQKALQDECDFASADTANKAFAVYGNESPDIVFLDIGLPDNDGNSVLEWIVKNDPNACVIMLSGRGNVDNISDCMEHGAKGFISKPFVKDDLVHFIRKYA